VYSLSNALKFCKGVIQNKEGRKLILLPLSMSTNHTAKGHSISRLDKFIYGIGSICTAGEV